MSRHTQFCCFLLILIKHLAIYPPYQQSVRVQHFPLSFCTDTIARAWVSDILNPTGNEAVLIQSPTSIFKARHHIRSVIDVKLPGSNTAVHPYMTTPFRQLVVVLQKRKEIFYDCMQVFCTMSQLVLIDSYRFKLTLHFLQPHSVTDPLA